MVGLCVHLPLAGITLRVFVAPWEEEGAGRVISMGLMSGALEADWI